MGSAVRVLSRWNQHRSLLNKGKHHSQHLQSSWGKHGQAAFEFLISDEFEAYMMQNISANLMQCFVEQTQ